MKMLFKRHYLVEITGTARELIFHNIMDSYSGTPYFDEVEKIFIKGYGSVFIPGIIRRDEEELGDGSISLGFSSLNKFNGNRLRIPCRVKSGDIKKVTDPYEVMKMVNKRRNGCLNLLDEILKISEDDGIEAGVWGSAGLELYTGLPYTSDDSDIDILVRPSGFEKLKNFNETIKMAGKRFNVKVDAELDLSDGYGIKLEELFMGTGTLLGKSLSGVELIPRADVLKDLSTVN